MTSAGRRAGHPGDRLRHSSGSPAASSSGRGGGSDRSGRRRNSRPRTGDRRSRSQPGDDFSTAVLGMIASVPGIDPRATLGGAAYAVGGAVAGAPGRSISSPSGRFPDRRSAMRFFDIRIEHEGKWVIGPRRAFRRLVGFWLSAIPFCLGFLGFCCALTGADSTTGWARRWSTT